MAKSKQTIIAEMESYIERCGGMYGSWYVGITNDAKQRLFVEHNVSEEHDHWCWREAATSDIAREIEKYFLDVRKTKGGPGGGGDDSVYVYAYEIAKQTVE